MDFVKEYKYLEDKEHIFKELSYDGLMDMINNLGTGLVVMGGPWCEYTQSIMKELNDIGKKAGIDVIYNYDPRFVDVFNEITDLRECKTLEIKLKYYALVEKIHYKNDELVPDTLISKIDTPFIFGIKDGECVGYFTIQATKNEEGLLVPINEKSSVIDFYYNVTSIINKLKNLNRYYWLKDQATGLLNLTLKCYNYYIRKKRFEEGILWKK